LTYFLIQLVLSFLIGGAVVSASITLSDRLGSNIGGAIAGFPSTAAISLLFIGLTSGVLSAVETAEVIPIFMGFNGIFLLMYAATVDRVGIRVAIAIALGVWMLLSMLLQLLPHPSFGESLLIWGLILLATTATNIKILQLPIAAGNRGTMSITDAIRRGLLGGTIIAAAVAATKLGGPVVGALFAGFPALYLSTMWIASTARGALFAKSLILPLSLSGMINVTAYVSTLRIVYPAVGVWWGTAGCYVVALCSAFLVFKLVQRLTVNL
jgi:hypothetical protein